MAQNQISEFFNNLGISSTEVAFSQIGFTKQAVLDLSGHDLTTLQSDLLTTLVEVYSIVHEKGHSEICPSFETKNPNGFRIYSTNDQFYASNFTEYEFGPRGLDDISIYFMFSLIENTPLEQQSVNIEGYEIKSRFCLLKYATCTYT